MAKVTYTARVEVSANEIISIMTVEYPFVEGISWSAQRIHMERQEDGTVVYGPCEDRVDSGQIGFASHEEALKNAVTVAISTVG